MTFVFVAMVVSAAPVDIGVDVTSGAPCVTKTSLESALSSRGLKVGKGGLNVRADGSPSQLVLTASRGAQKFERTVPVASGDCDAVTRVAVALISSWATPSRDDDSKRATGAVVDAGVASTTNGTSRVESDDAGVGASPSRVQSLDAGVGSSVRALTTRVESVDAGAGSSVRASPSRVESVYAGMGASPSRGESVDASVGASVRASASRVESDDAGVGASATRVGALDAGAGSSVRASAARVESVDSGVGASVRASTSRVESVDAGVASSVRASTTSGSARTVDAGIASTTTESPPELGPAARPDEAIRSGLDAGVETTPPDPLLARIGATGTDFVTDAVIDAGVAEPAAPLRLDVLALGGVGNDPLSVPEPVTTGLGQLGVRGALGRWGILLDVGFDSARSRSLGDVTVTASSQWLSLSFSVAFQPAERFSFDLALGMRGWRFGGSATGVDAPQQRDFFSLGGVVSAGFNVRIVGPLHVQLRPFASLRGNRGAFLVENLGTVIPIEPLTFGALLGAMLRFD